MNAPPKKMEDDNVLVIAELAVVSWKLLGALARELETAPADRVEAGEAMIRFTQRKLDQTLEKSEMKLVTYERQDWSAQIPASPLNLSDVDAEKIAIHTTVEPTILNGTRVILPGKILLRNA